jgi:glucose-6-phosphate-specific signal transduction histidine kinase
LELWIRDDGVGGADPTRGSGIVGLTDRIEALGGTIAVASPPGEGTSVMLALPLEPVESNGDRLEDIGWPLGLPPAP